MKVIVAGGRDFTKKKKLFKVLDKFLDGRREVTIINGAAEGADDLGGEYALERKLDMVIFPANWKGRGNGAGYIRNAAMAEYGTHLVAFWDGKSPGTKGMIEVAKRKGLEVKVVKYKNKKGK